jgi:hypothetical protein
MRYTIPYKTSGGVFMTAEGKTPLAALRALGGSSKFANATRHNDDGSSTQGFIQRDGRSAEFHANDDLEPYQGE